MRRRASSTPSTSSATTWPPSCGRPRWPARTSARCRAGGGAAPQRGRARGAAAAGRCPDPGPGHRRRGGPAGADAERALVAAQEEAARLLEETERLLEQSEREAKERADRIVTDTLERRDAVLATCDEIAAVLHGTVADARRQLVELEADDESVTPEAEESVPSAAARRGDGPARSLGRLERRPLISGRGGSTAPGRPGARAARRSSGSRRRAGSSPPRRAGAPR